MHDHERHRYPLLHTPNIQVDACDCGHVHLTVGVLTLRFEVPAFLELVTTLGQAAQRIEAAQRRRWLAPKLDA